MTPERWGQVKELYHSAAEQDREARQALLDEVRSRDPELCAEVESLLRESADTWDMSPNPFENLEMLEKRRGGLEVDRYRLVRELGRGGFGVVYLAQDQRLHQKPVVIKFLPGAAGPDGWANQKFEDEVKALASIDHPGVVGILDAGRTAEGIPFLVMQYVEGVTLRSLIGPEGMPLNRTAQILRQLGQALAAAHTRGILHRDLKPENVMVQTSVSGEFVRLIDFGIATFSESRETTRAAGTLAYMAPEQLRGNPSIASDVFAMGVIAWEMLTGKLPPAEGPSPELRELRPDVPAEAAAVLRKALSAEPAARFQNAGEFADELALALTGGKPRPAPDLSPVQQRALDVAAARQIPIHKPAEVVAMIRRAESGGLTAILEVDREYSVTKDDVRSKAFHLEFPVDRMGHPQALELGLRIECPDFEPKAAFKTIPVPPDRDSEPCTFLITPRYLGELRINLEVVRRDVLVASRILKTEAIPSEREADGSKVLVSIPLEVRVSPPREAPGGEFTRMFGAPGAAFPAASAPPPPPGQPPGPSEYTMLATKATGAFAGAPEPPDPNFLRRPSPPVIPQPALPRPREVAPPPPASRKVPWVAIVCAAALLGGLILLFLWGR